MTKPLPGRWPKRLLATLLIVGALLLAACGSATPTPTDAPASPPPARDYWPTDGWRSNAPANHGLDETALAGLQSQIEQELPFLDSLLIVKDGYLVYEEYFNGYDVDRLHPVHSVTKSVLSALFGIAQADGSIPNLDAKLGDVLVTSISIGGIGMVSKSFRKIGSTYLPRLRVTGYYTCPPTKLCRLSFMAFTGGPGSPNGFTDTRPATPRASVDNGSTSFRVWTWSS